MKIRKKIFVLFFEFLFLSTLALAQPFGGGGGGSRGLGGGGPGGSGSDRGGGNFRPAPRRSSSKSRDTQAFNGMRVSKSHDPFQVVVIEVKEKSIFVSFNICTNSRSFKKENILLNGVPLDEATKTRFNITGKRLEIQRAIPNGEEATLEFKDVKSYDDETLVVTKFESLSSGTKKEFPIIKREDLKKESE